MNNPEPLVSVIIPAFKAERYLGDALRSLREQTYGNWEAIVVEDGWRDRTEAIVREFAAEVPHNAVTFLRHAENKGLGATRNTGIRAAKGKYIGLLDHDDLWRSEHLANAVAALEENGVDFVYSTIETFEDSPERTTGTWGPTPEEIRTFPASLYTRNFVTTASSVIRKDAMEAVGLYDTLRACEDYDLVLKMARAGYRFLHIEPPTSLYRRHPEGLTGNRRLMLTSMSSVLARHADWPALPGSVRRKRLATIWAEMAETHLGTQPLVATTCFLRALRQQPLLTGFWTAKWLVCLPVGWLFRGQKG